MNTDDCWAVKVTGSLIVRTMVPNDDDSKPSIQYDEKHTRKSIQSSTSEKTKLSSRKRNKSRLRLSRSSSRRSKKNTKNSDCNDLLSHENNKRPATKLVKDLIASVKETAKEPELHATNKKAFDAEPTNSGIVKALGREGRPVVRGQYENQNINVAVFTSGGDSQGMNAAIRAVIRTGIYVGCHMYVIREGYQGMVDGGGNIEAVDWNFASNIIQTGGTIIGSARCKDFRERPGRLAACRNLLKHGISNLVCIGGDGSLTGANLFRTEWPQLVSELVKQKQVSSDAAAAFPRLNIVGMVGSIDNDFCGTDMTIGADTALWRIIEAVDAVAATAQSHQRAFIIEVMGRHCGYLALMSALACEADWVFVPEHPAPTNWPELLCTKMQLERQSGQRVNIIILSEGALDVSGAKVSAEQVRQVIRQRLGYDTRVTVLGHVQRGGAPSAFDRLLGCRMGAEAVLALLDPRHADQPCVIGVDGNDMVRLSLMHSVEASQAVNQALREKRFAEAEALRGASFQRNMNLYRLLSKFEPSAEKMRRLVEPGRRCLNIGVVNIGSPACGVNAAVWALVRMGIYHKCCVKVVYDSFEGLVAGKFKAMDWLDVNGWVLQGGSRLGARKDPPEDWDKVAASLQQADIHGLVLIGGFQAFNTAIAMMELRTSFEQFRIPIVVLPATPSNNVPGSCLTVGADTALNEICSTIDKIKQSALGTKRRCFIIETMGGYCGYLASLAALASGADNAYIFEEKFGLDDMQSDINVIARKMASGAQRYVVTRAERANKHFTADFIARLFAEEGAGSFETRVNVLGHHQQGGTTSPFDRILAIKLAVRVVEWLVQRCSMSSNLNSDSVVVVGMVSRALVFTPVSQLQKQTDFAHNLPLNQWWLKLRPLLRLLSQHDTSYETEAFEGDELPLT